MAQLPPKVPTMTPNWPSFPHQAMSNYLSNSIATTTTPAAAAADNHHHQPSWVDEFLDFTSARRGAHRRSISDSIAFLETTAMTPILLDDTNNNNTHSSNGNNIGFDKLDDEQLMSMFSDDVSLSLPPSSSNPSTPSDQNSNNDDQKTSAAAGASDHQQYNLPLTRPEKEEEFQKAKIEPGLEDDSSCQQESQNNAATQQNPNSFNADTIFDPKRVKRILANRQSAQRSRVRKLQYISELERSVTTLQTEVSALSPRVAFLDHQRLILNVDNSALKQRIAALAQDKIFKDAHQEALKKEIERLRQVYHQQNLKKMNENNNAQSLQQEPPNSNTIQCTDKKQVLIN